MSKKKPQDDYNSIYVPKEAKPVKRFAAWVVDIILIIVAATGIMFLTSLAYGYDKYNEIRQDKLISYGLYVECDPILEDSFTFKGKTYIAYSEAVDGYTEAERDSRVTSLNSDKDYRNAVQKTQYGSLIITTSGIVGSLLIFEFILPLCLKNGRTIGQFFFGIGFVTDEDIRIQPKNVFVRFLFGKVIFNALIPYAGIMFIIYPTGLGLVGIVLIVGILVANLFMLFVSPQKRSLAECIARVKPIDNTCQIYIDTVEELASLKAEEARNKKTYDY